MNIYLDNAATSPMNQEVIETMVETMNSVCGNPSSTHKFGRTAKTLIEKARKSIAKHIHAKPSEIIFTAGGSEADNMVLQNAVCHLGVTKIITSRIEHHAVLHTVEKLYVKNGIEVGIVDVDSIGEVNYTHLEELLKASDGQKVLVSLMFANNEIGTILDIDRVGALCKQHEAYFHSDAVQGVGHYAINMETMPMDFIVASAHKFHGPKGVGFVYCRKGIALSPMIYGGAQEKGCRAGTENVHGIVGMEKAMDLVYADLDKDVAFIQGLKDYFIQELKASIPGVAFNGTIDSKKSSYCILNVRFPFENNMLLFNLDLKGIACSGGSACQSGGTGGSHVLNTILTNEEAMKASVRFSLSHYNTKEEIDYVISSLKEFL